MKYLSLPHFFQRSTRCISTLFRRIDAYLLLLYYRELSPQTEISLALASIDMFPFGGTSGYEAFASHGFGPRSGYGDYSARGRGSDDFHDENQYVRGCADAFLNGYSRYSRPEKRPSQQNNYSSRYGGGLSSTQRTSYGRYYGDEDAGYDFQRGGYEGLFSRTPQQQRGDYANHDGRRDFYWSESGREIYQGRDRQRTTAQRDYDLDDFAWIPLGPDVTGGHQSTAEGRGLNNVAEGRGVFTGQEYYHSSALLGRLKVHGNVQLTRA